MVTLNKIYTKSGDTGTTALGTGDRLAKNHPRVNAYGTVDETNATVGIARIHCSEYAEIDAMLGRIQNDLFDLGADLCTPEAKEPLDYKPLRIMSSQTQRLEQEIDYLNNELKPLRSFTLPGGHPAAAYLHLCRTISRRAERLIVELIQTSQENINPEAVKYINRLSDLFFVASRYINNLNDGDILWMPGENNQIKAK